MSDQAQAAQGSTATAKPTFKQMNLGQKCIFIGKCALCILSFGFLYSHVFTGE